MGRSFSDKEVQADMRHMPFTVKSGPADKPVVEVDVGGSAKQYTPEEVSAMVLAKMKDVAESYLGQKSVNPFDHLGFLQLERYVFLT